MKPSQSTMSDEASSHALPLLVSVKEAGRLLGGIGQTKVYDLLSKRELPFVKIGRSTRIELAAIHAFIERERIGSKPRVNR
jgi:excisionase family DNA binding protein